jgi:PAS domain S-box-containing protein
MAINPIFEILKQKNKGYKKGIQALRNRIRSVNPVVKTTEQKFSVFSFENIFRKHDVVMLLVEGETGKIIDANHAAEKFYRYSLQQFKSLNISDINKMPPNQVKIEHQQAYKEKQRFFIFPHRLANGEIRIVEVHTTPIIVNETKYLFSIIHDITAGKQIEEELLRSHQQLIKAKEKAEESDNLKTAFLQNMSHEIRTPMNAIIGFSNMIEKPDLSPEKRKIFTTIIVNSTRQLLSVVNNILTISSVDTKQETISIKSVCINHIIANLLEFFKAQAFSQNISLYSKKPLSDRQSEIYTDGTKVTQILTNLITNALKFTPNGFIEFGYILKEKQLEFYVKDSGIGIKTKMQKKIFERFRQADGDITRKYGGTGLGLAISKGFVELLGGKLRVQSKIKKGSTFYFTIPYKPVQESGVVSFPANQNGNTATILIAEDEEYNYLLLEEIIIDMDFGVVHAKNGLEAVEICKANPQINLTLMDIKLPVMDGHTAAKQIKEFRPDLPIIAQSAYALAHEIEKYRGNTFDDYITKPINEDELRQKVMKYISIRK